MEDNIFKKRNPEAVPWRKKYPVWLDRYLGVVVSISIHLVLLAFLSYLIFYTPTEKKQHFNIDISELKIPELDIKLPDEIRIENMTDSITPDNSAENAVDSVASSSKSPDFITTTTPPAEWLQLGTTASLPSFSDGFISLGDAALAGGFTSGNAFGYRKSQKGKTGNSFEKAGNKITINALNYLKDTQNPDGSWGDAGESDLRNALSSLALLGFLAYGEDTATPLFGDTVRAALRFLLKHGTENNTGNQPDSFGEALMTYALAEGASVTQIPELLGITRIRTKQIQKKLSLQENAWSKGTLSAWNYQALKAAAFAIDRKEFDIFTKRIILQLLQYHRKQCENLGRRSNLNELNNIFLRTYSLQLFGYAKHKTVAKYFSRALRAGGDTMFECRWDTGETWPLYHWYYRSNAIFSSQAHSNDMWNKWFRKLVDTLQQHQNANGSFISPEISGAYNQSGENIPTFKSERNLAIYSTALCALMLQTKFRYRTSYFEAGKNRKIQLVPPEISQKTGTATVLKEPVTAQ